MKLNIQLNLTRWVRPRIHVFSIITWLRLNNNNKKALTCYKVFIIWLISRFSHYAFIKQNVIYSRARHLCKGRHNLLINDWNDSFQIGCFCRVVRQLEVPCMLFFLSAYFHFPKFCLCSLSPPLIWVISARVVTPSGATVKSLGWNCSEILLFTSSKESGCPRPGRSSSLRWLSWC